MPIPAVCPTCLARLSAPDETAGKRIKCPKCQNPVAVPRAGPGAGVVETDDWPIRPARRDRPRRSERPAGVPVAWVVAGAAVFLLLAAGGALAGWYFLQAEPAKPPPVAEKPPPAPAPDKPAPAGPAPVKWVAFDSKATHYTASFPNKAPNKVETLDQFTLVDPKQLADALGPELSKEIGLGAGGTLTTDTYGTTDGGRRYLIGGMVNPGSLSPELEPAKLLERAKVLAGQAYQGAEIESSADLKVAGYPARHLVLRQAGRTVLVRYVAAVTHFFTLRVEGDSEMKPDDPTAKEFFDKFKPYPPKKK